MTDFLVVVVLTVIYAVLTGIFGPFFGAALGSLLVLAVASFGREKRKNA